MCQSQSCRNQSEAPLHNSHISPPITFSSFTLLSSHHLSLFSLPLSFFSLPLALSLWLAFQIDLLSSARSASLTHTLPSEPVSVSLCVHQDASLREESHSDHTGLKSASREERVNSSEKGCLNDAQRKTEASECRSANASCTHVPME